MLVATSRELEGIGGRYFEAAVLDPSASDTATHGVAAYAVDPGNAERLWQVSLQLVS